MWSVISSFSNLHRWSSPFNHVPLNRDQGDWDWRLRLYDTPNAIGCVLKETYTYMKRDLHICEKRHMRSEIEIVWHCKCNRLYKIISYTIRTRDIWWYHMHYDIVYDMTCSVYDNRTRFALVICDDTICIMTFRTSYPYSLFDHIICIIIFLKYCLYSVYLLWCVMMKRPPLFIGLFRKRGIYSTYHRHWRWLKQPVSAIPCQYRTDWHMICIFYIAAYP